MNSRFAVEYNGDATGFKWAWRRTDRSQGLVITHGGWPWRWMAWLAGWVMTR